MSNFLFDEFEGTTPNAWKQKIQVDLKGADYNKTLLWKTNDGITVKPFYTKEDRKNNEIKLPKKAFNICQTIVITEEATANAFAKKSLKTGVSAIQFIAHKKFDYKILLSGIDVNKTILYFKLLFLDAAFIQEINQLTAPKNTFFQIDPVGNLAESGNWFFNLKEDLNHLNTIFNSVENGISISGDLYQNAGANIVQQLAYTLAHANEYLNILNKKSASSIHFEFAVGSNYFHEIAKLRAFRLLWKSLLNEYKIKETNTHIFTKPSTRNKTIYDYNTNMLRTATECMSAVLGGSNSVSNLAYNTIFEDSTEFGERISKNQLLILQEESSFTNAQNLADGSYYIENLTHQFAEKALVIFKQIEKGGGFLKQLKEGNIQRKIKDSASSEQEQFRTKELVLLGTNFQPNKNDLMFNNIKKEIFAKKRNIKTLIIPINRKRLSEAFEKNQLKKENKI
ncbi:methylmalonyl-CoA mutase subunit beta [uncultured Polaribacter sp.]|uniref:methylmalonyl-CoA mutase subunit beta n=1 Tax=uncultured Polaribacter sp. TaxID=174711 RepID=UPI00261CB6B3|nr:methylmalonyl-CoA mutase subunit beta [uncultured Polaribacter sp.]